MGGGGGEMAGVLHVYKIVCSKLCPRCSHKPLLLYLLFSSVFISNKTVNVAGEHC